MIATIKTHEQGWVRDRSAAPAYGWAERHDALWSALPALSIAFTLVLRRVQFNAAAWIALDAILLLFFALKWFDPKLVRPVTGAAFAAMLVWPTQIDGSAMAAAPVLGIVLLLTARMPFTEASALSLARLFSFIALTKPFLNLLVIGTTLAGFYLGSDGHAGFVEFVATLTGAALVAAGSCAINQHNERDLDALLERTAKRPLPLRELAPDAALRFGILLSIMGLVVLLAGTGPLPALLAANAMAVYLFIYTPMKRTSPLATIAGAVSGALPPLIGWAAAGELNAEAWRLFLIVFLWQVPHFLAIGWRWRSDYANAGVPIYCVLDPTGRATGLHMIHYSAAVVALSMMPCWTGSAGIGYAFCAGMIAWLLIGPAAAFAVWPSRGAARRVFIATIAYMPLLLALMATAG